jgi:hypothetical protein
MPEPDPDGIQIEEYDDGTFRLWAEVWADGNRRHRLDRLKAVSRNLRRGGWRCIECGKPVPLYRRADAEYWGERCRKRRARRLRRARRAD